MRTDISIDLGPIRDAMAGLEISPHVVPNQTINLERVFFPDGHRSVLDTSRPLVVGNRGVGKSFWTHALTNPDVRDELSRTYKFANLAKTNVVIGFNASTKPTKRTPTIQEVNAAHSNGSDPEVIWKSAILKAVSAESHDTEADFASIVKSLQSDPSRYASELSAIDDRHANDGTNVLIVFDALDRLASDWPAIRKLSRGLLLTVLGLQSFLRIRAKVFMRADQFADVEIFRFPDSSKIRNDRVDLAWRPFELYSLLLFELMRQVKSAEILGRLARDLDASSALPVKGTASQDRQKQETIINAIAGEYMGRSAKRGRVYSWVPLHLGDALNHCSPRTFLTAWKTAADHNPAPNQFVVDHLGLNEGVRNASRARLAELKEDYPWIDLALNPLGGQFVPIEKKSLFELWTEAHVTDTILQRAHDNDWLAPVSFTDQKSADALLQTLTSIAVMEERANGKVNVPDIFRVEAGILRKGGVAVPKKK